MTNSLDQLKQYTTVVSDSGDFESIAAYKPQDATTNPSLILAAVKKPQYAKLMDVAVKYAKEKGSSKDKQEQIDLAVDRVLVEFGKEILQIVPGRVSTEVDAALSFDTQRTIDKALHIIDLYKSLGIDKDRVLIKIASTYEGIKAAQELEAKHGIHCNLTLLFGFGQAVACAEAQVTLISPFVGRILDWHKKNLPDGKYDGANDPGVKSVRRIYNYYKQHGYKTIVMGASFRNTSEIRELCGCDFLTISPALLEELKNSDEKFDEKLNAEAAKAEKNEEKATFINDRAAFQWALLQETMAFDKLHEGIRAFAKDADTLKGLLADKLNA